jgi:hypothetical protein
MIQMLVGGGWVIDLATITSILATRIDKPLEWWRSHLPKKFQYWLTKLFPPSLLGYAIISLSMLVLTIVGVNDVTVIQPMEILATTMFLPILLMILGGLAHDIQRQFGNSLESEIA